MRRRGIDRSTPVSPARSRRVRSRHPEVLVTCASHTLRSIAALVAISIILPASLRAQQPIPAPPSATLAPYRAPVIALVQPAPFGTAGTTTGAGSVPQDRPVVVFRFAAGESDDPLDVGSFVVAVDGVDRTAAFQVTATQAWGPLVDAVALARGQLAVGPHRVAARICSTRHACTTTEAQLLVVPGLTPIASADSSLKRTLLRRALGTLGEATRKLILP